MNHDLILVFLNELKGQVSCIITKFTRTVNDVCCHNVTLWICVVLSLGLFVLCT